MKNRETKNWTKKEIDFLLENYPTNGTKYCAEKLERSRSSIQKRCFRLNLLIDSNTKTLICKTTQLRYQNNRTDEDFKINIKQFITIENPHVAYILGYLWADGYIVRDEIRLELIRTDLDYIKPILESIGSWNYYYRHRKGRSESGRAVVSNKRLVQFLIECDYHKKSHVSAKKILSYIPEQLKHYFFRGLIDGDGCISVSDKKCKGVVSVAGSYKQDWSYITDKCEELSIPYYIYRYNKNVHKHSCIEINYSNAKIFCDYIYQGEQFGLQRKYKKYLNLVELISNSRKNLIEIKKTKALELYKNGISIKNIIKIIEIPSTTLRRYLKSII